MAILYSGLLIFFGTHLYATFRSREPGRDIKERIGENKYMGIYSVLSALGLGLIILGYMQAGAMQLMFFDPLGLGYTGSRSLVSIMMIVSFVLIVAAYVPTSNIKARLRHPMLLAVIVWAAAHLVDGASLKQLLLFGSFMLFSIVNIVAVSLRPAGQTSAGQPKLINDVIAVAIGCLVYAGTMTWLHGGITDLSPFGF